jgi:glycosyltransferase involved in cell wall biosynthesis
MRITFILPRASLGGGTRVVAIHADRLQKRGHQVTVVCGRAKPQPLKRKLRALLQGRGWPKTPTQEPSHLDDVNVDCRILPRSRPVADCDVPDADVVIATWWETAEWVANLSPSKGAKVYFLQHYEAHGVQPVDRVDATWRLPMHKIAIAQWLVDLAATRFNDQYVSLVPNSVDTNLFNAPPRHKNPQPTVGLMYSKSPTKGCDVSLQAFRLAQPAIPNLKLLSFGFFPPNAGPPLPANTEYHQTPAQSTIADIYRRCDAWLFASRNEGFGLPLLEAMACRTPVIATPSGAAPELLAAGGGQLVPIDDPQAMAHAIQRLANMTDDQWRHMSDAAFATATRYSWDDAADRFQAALTLALQRAAQGELATSTSP